MTTSANADRRAIIRDKLAAVVGQPGADRIPALREIAASVLSFSPVSDAPVAVDVPILPSLANVIARLDNDFGPNFTAMHFDLSAESKTLRAISRVSNAQIQAAYGIVQQYAQEEQNPLLIFTLPDDSGLQFVTGSPAPGSSNRLDGILRVSVYWNSLNRTALDCLDHIGREIASGGVPERAFQSGLNVQPVTEEFFQDYKAAYDAAVGLIAESMERTGAEQFTQILFNRLMFVHFVSRKGWLRFNGNPDYLNALWKDYQANDTQSNDTQANFYNNRLATLFFAGLNNPQSLNLMRDNPAVYALIGDVPFLNGGLFDRTELDQRPGTIVPDEAITSLITGLFNSYNFTVTEATPLDTEVAVDPEMLGKLFEETVNERHSNGAYYTPRPVVAFMCREALKGFIAGREIGGLDDGSIAELVDGRKPEAITLQQALEIANAVAEMKTVDPACGSGAFLLGMLQEILALNDTLFRAGKSPESLYRQKLGIITNNIYGADKDGLAVSAAMLRLWLSLAVDYEGDGAPDPLPNLDLKLVVGDAIAGPDPQQLDFTQQSIVNSGLAANFAAYTTAQGQRKATLKREIEETKQQLRDNMGDAAPAGVVEWRIDFADVMLNGGFDVVIANPPYVRQEDIGPQKDALARQYAAAVTARSDLYCYFYARGLQLLAEGGMHVFVCSNSWLDVGYGAKLQEHLLKNAHIRAVYESAVERQFATADINTVISLVRKTASPANSDETRFVSLRGEFDTALADAGQRREISRNRAQLRAGGTAGGKFTGDKWGGKYLRAPDIYHHILDNYGDKLVRLGDVATVRFGIKTGANDFFYLTPERIAEFGIEDEYCRPVMTTPQESRSIAVNPDTLPKRLFMCHKDKDELNWQNKRYALEYIKYGEEQGYHRRSSVKSRRRWYDLGKCDKSQLALNYVIDTTARTYYFQDGCLFPNVFHTAQSKDGLTLQLCAVLNSTLAQLFINLSGRGNLGGGALKLELYEFEGLQIVNPTLLAEPKATAFNAADWDVLAPSAARRHIDAAVFDALGLTVEEREAVYAGVAELVGNRKRRARSVGGSASGAPVQTPRKPEFQVVPNKSGLAPGVTPDNLKDIIFELEEEEFLEKLNQ